MINKIYCDMDGVLCDFIKAVEDHTGQELEPGFGYGNFPEVWREMDVSTLPKTEYFDVLYQFLVDRLESGYEVHLATALPVTMAADRQKWIAEHMPEFVDRVIYIQDKGLLDSTDALLIDDKPSGKWKGDRLRIPCKWQVINHSFKIDLAKALYARLS